MKHPPFVSICIKLPLLELRPEGLYCPSGDFYVDPWKPVERAVVTHGHADHARWGSKSYLCAKPGEGILKVRLSKDASIQGVPYGQAVRFGETSVTLYPSGHILGSAQVKIEANGYSWVVSGDYKLEPDPTCAAFEPVRCNGFVTEATFALPIYRWAPDSVTFHMINDWWRENSQQNRASILYGYSLGKAQRLLAGVDPSIGPIYTHGAVERLNDVYRSEGIVLPKTTYALAATAGKFAGSLVVAPPSMNGSTWLRRFGDFSTAMASGWMQVRGHRRRRAVDLSRQNDNVLIEQSRNVLLTGLTLGVAKRRTTTDDPDRSRSIGGSEKSHRQEDNPEANRCGAKGKRAPDKADAFQTEAAG